MLIDSNLVLKEGDAYATGAGDALALTSLKFAGRMEPIPFIFKVTTSYTGGTSMTFKLQQSDTENGSYTDVDGSSFTLALAALVVGAEAPIRYLPRGVTKPWIKLAYTAAGTFTAGKIFAGVTRESPEAYAAGMYIDSGTVVG